MASPCGSGQHPGVLLAFFLSDSELILWQANGRNSKHAWDLATAHISVGPPVSTHGSRVRSHPSSAQGPNPATAASSLLHGCPGLHPPAFVRLLPPPGTSPSRASQDWLLLIIQGEPKHHPPRGSAFSYSLTLGTWPSVTSVWAAGPMDTAISAQSIVG